MRRLLFSDSCKERSRPSRSFHATENVTASSVHTELLGQGFLVPDHGFERPGFSPSVPAVNRTSRSCRFRGGWSHWQHPCRRLGLKSWWALVVGSRSQLEKAEFLRVSSHKLIQVPPDYYLPFLVSRSDSDNNFEKNKVVLWNFLSLIISVLINAYKPSVRSKSVWFHKDEKQKEGLLAGEFKDLAGETQSRIDELPSLESAWKRLVRFTMAKASRNAKLMQTRSLNTLGANASPEKH